MHHYVADVVGELHWQGDSKDDHWACRCVTGLWQSD